MDQVHMAFWYGLIVDEATWQVVLLILEGGSEFLGVGLVEVLWKMLVVILNRRLRAAITLHKVLCGFQVSRGTGTASLDSKLLQ